MNEFAPKSGKQLMIIRQTLACIPITMFAWACTAGWGKGRREKKHTRGRLMRKEKHIGPQISVQTTTK